MANVVAPSSEGKKTAQAYLGADSSPIVFSIPVFFNMPASACPEPGTSQNPNNYLASLEVESVSGTKYQLTPSFDGAKDTPYSLIVEHDVNAIRIKATTVSKKATPVGIGFQPLEVGMNSFTITVLAEDGSKREYKLYVVRE